MTTSIDWEHKKYDTLGAVDMLMLRLWFLMPLSKRSQTSWRNSILQSEQKTHNKTSGSVNSVFKLGECLGPRKKNIIPHSCMNHPLRAACTILIPLGAPSYSSPAFVPSSEQVFKCFHSWTLLKLIFARHICARHKFTLKINVINHACVESALNICSLKNLFFFFFFSHVV